MSPHARFATLAWISNFCVARVKSSMKKIAYWRLHQVVLELSDHVGALLEAGLSLEEGISHLEQVATGKMKHVVLAQTRQQLEHGKTLSTAWKPYIPATVHSLLRSGEQSGELTTVLRQHVERCTAKHAWQGQLIRIISYPCLLVCMTIGLLVYVANVVLPMFHNMYQEMGYQITASTRLIQRVLMLSPTIILSGFLVVCVFAIALFLVAKKCPTVRSFAWRYMPGLGLVRTNRTCTLAGHLSMLIGAGVPLVTALEVVQRGGPSNWLTKTSLEIRRRILAGERLCFAFAGEWEPILFTLLQTAEKTGDLAAAFAKTETFARHKLHASLERLAHVLEPCLLCGMGFVVGLTMYAVFIPMYDFISVISDGSHV